MRILVTGAAGFIGFHLVARLLEEGHDVVGFDNFSPYYDVRLKRDRQSALLAAGARIGAGGGRLRFVEGDICEAGGLRAAFEAGAPECVVHLAAQPGMRDSLRHPLAYQKVNVEGFLNVLECCRHAAARPRLVYASSSSVYGGNTALPFSEEQPVDRPVSLYAATKKAGELMAHAYAHLYGIRAVGLRFFTVYGPWGRPDMAMTLFAEAMVRGRPVRVFNRGELRRDFTYVGDVVDGVARCVAAAAADFGPHEIFNVGSSRPERLLDMVRLLADGLGVEPRLEFLPMQDGDMPATWADIGKLQAKTGYRPVTPLSEGVPKFVAWFRDYAEKRREADGARA
jgi:UDP-glucuronate 4-epimerase